MAKYHIIALGVALASGSNSAGSGVQQCSKDKIVFMKADPANPFETAEIYIMNPDSSEPLRLTDDGFGDAMPSLSRDGKGKIAFDSNRTAVALGAPVTTSNTDLFLLNPDPAANTKPLPTPLTRGSSASWSPDRKRIAFHRSQSAGYGARIPGRGEPGGPTRDSDIFVVNVDNLLAKSEEPTNITANFEGQTPGVKSSEDDPDWSPDGSRIVFTSRNSACETMAACQAAAEIWVMNANGTNPKRLTINNEEERSPDWSPDGTRIIYMCRRAAGGPFEICVMNADGTAREVLTNNAVADLSPSWSPDGTKIVFQRGSGGQQQVYVMNYAADENGRRKETPLTYPPSINLMPSWGTVSAGCGPATRARPRGMSRPARAGSRTSLPSWNE